MTARNQRLRRFVESRMRDAFLILVDSLACWPLACLRLDVNLYRFLQPVRETLHILSIYPN